MAKYITVEIAGQVGILPADLFGAASVMQDHPVHKFPKGCLGLIFRKGNPECYETDNFQRSNEKILNSET